jgi:hypothetical protein
MEEKYKKGVILEIFKIKRKRSLQVMIKDYEVGEFSIPLTGTEEILKDLKVGAKIFYKADRYYNITELFVLAYKDN